MQNRNPGVHMCFGSGWLHIKKTIPAARVGEPLKIKERTLWYRTVETFRVSKNGRCNDFILALDCGFTLFSDSDFLLLKTISISTVLYGTSSMI